MIVESEALSQFADQPDFSLQLCVYLQPDGKRLVAAR